MESKLSRWCDGLIEAGWLLAIVGTPLFFNIHSSRVFEPDKLTLLRSIALLMVVAWVVKFLDQRGWQELSWVKWKNDNTIWKKPFILVVGLLALVYIISAIFSVTPAVSWLGSYQRLQGTYTTLSYIVVFALMVATIRTRVQVNRVITTAIVTSIPISLYAMLQHFGLDPLPWGGNTQTRVAGHMGNSIFVAAYLILVLPLTLSRIIDAFTNILEDVDLSISDVIRSSIYIFTLAIQLIAIYWTNSRGPWLGLAVALFAYVLIVLVNLRNASEKKGRFQLAELGMAFGYAWGGSLILFFILNAIISGLTGSGRFSSLAGPLGSFVAFLGAMTIIVLGVFILMAARQGWRWLWLSWLAVSILVGAWLVAFNLAGSLEGTQPSNPVSKTLLDWREIEISSIRRLGRILESDSGTGRVRVLIWQGAIDLITPHEPIKSPDGSGDPFNFLRPLIGYGPESMYVAYNSFYPPELATVEARNASPDRSHNETIDALVITGISGFVVWQLLYLSLFFYGFRWLGIMSTTTDKWVFIGLWFLGAIVTTILLVNTQGIEFFGVAIPFGSILGLIIYLIYYALFASTNVESDNNDPFNADRLALVGLVSAVIAHYVEIHFGIAIASTRTHFFVFLALIFLTGYLLPKINESDVSLEEEVEEIEEVATKNDVKTSKRRRRKVAPSRRTAPGWISPILAAAFIMAVIIAILGFNFTTYSLPPGEQITSIEDVPTAGDIFYQTMFIHSREGFTESPYLYLVVTLTWALGSLLFLSELAKDGVIRFQAWGERVAEEKRMVYAGIFALWAIIGLILRFVIITGPDISTTALLGRSLILIWAGLTAWAALGLFRNQENAGQVAGVVAGVGLVMALPVLIAGNWLVGLGLAISCGAILYFLWDRNMEQLVMPGLTLSLSSLILGLGYSYIHANRLRSSFLSPVPQGQEVADTVRRILEADQAAGILSLFYIFTIFMMLLMGFALAWQRMSKIRQSGDMTAYVALAVLMFVGFFAINRTNLRVIQADIVYKRADPWERQASRANDPNVWDQAIAIYEHAVELAPTEDFYYLFLGRAYLEKASAQARAGDTAGQNESLETARTRLLRAQNLNPLNTDHTANLARLNTRWADFSSGAERTERIDAAELFYERAIGLSPNNAIIHNERARLAYAFEQNCEESISRYNVSAEVDRYFPDTDFQRAEIQIACATNSTDEAQDSYYDGAIISFETGLEKAAVGIRGTPAEQPRRWFQLGQLQQQLGNYDEAENALDMALQQADNSVPAWNVQYQLATLYQEIGDTEQAITAAQTALAQAPAGNQGQIQQLIAQLTGEPVIEPTPAPEQGALPTEPIIIDGAATLMEGERLLAGIPTDDRNNLFAGQVVPTVIDLGKGYEAVISTNKGDIRLRLYPQNAPLTVNNFVYLANQGFYDGIIFHRVLEDFMAQTGDPTGTGSGGPGYQFADETQNGLGFERAGILAMANSGPATNGSQFFITFAPTTWLNGNHTVFGEVIEGQDVLDNLTRRDPTQPNQPEADVMVRVDIYEIE